MINYDQIYGPNGKYSWPSSPQVAERFIEAALYTNSTYECLDDDFFFEYLNSLDQHIIYDYPEDEAYKLIEWIAKSRQQLFKDVKDWPLDNLIASATYKICSTKPEGVYMISRLWHCFFWPFLIFNGPLFDMFYAKGWDSLYRDQLRKSFTSLLGTEIYGGVTINKLIWGSDIDNGKEKLWFTCSGFARNVYPESVLRCLHLIGIDKTLAHLAVDEVFNLQSLVPLYNVLSNDTFPITATFLNCSDRGAREETKTFFIANNDQKPSTDSRINPSNFISGALLFVWVSFFMGFPRTRPSRPESNSAQIAQVAQTKQTEFEPCYAKMSSLWFRSQRTDVVRPPVEASSAQQPQQAGISASHSKKTRRIRERLSLTRNPQDPLIQEVKERWSISKASQGEINAVIRNELKRIDTEEEKSATTLFRQSLSDAKTKLQRDGHKLYNLVIKRVDIANTWIKGGRIFTEWSPEVIAFRRRLADKGIYFPNGTSLCIHARREKGEKGEKGRIVVTTQGTITDCNFQTTLMNHIEADFCINGKKVEKGAVHENDHILGSKIGLALGLRNLTSALDCAITIKQEQIIHAIRTAFYASENPRFEMKNLRKSLVDLLKPLEKADKKVWMDKKNRNPIFESGLTPTFLVRQYAHAHKNQLARIAYKLMFAGFTDKQATAYITNAFLQETIEMSKKVFISCATDFSKLRIATTLPRRIPEVEMRYCERVQLDNLEDFKTFWSNCVALSSDYELYSANGRYGCTPQQTEEHRKTKMLAIAGCKEAFREAFKPGLARGTISEEFITHHWNDMLSKANVDELGNPIGRPVSIKKLEARIIERGEAMKITSLYKRDGTFTLRTRTLAARKKLYAECADEVTRDPFTLKDILERGYYSEDNILDSSQEAARKRSYKKDTLERGYYSEDNILDSSQEAAQKRSYSRGRSL